MAERENTKVAQNIEEKEEMEETERKQREKNKIKESVGGNRGGGIASDDSRGQSLFTSPCRNLPLCKVIDAPACLWVFALYAFEFIVVIHYRLVKKKENKNK